MVTYGMEITNDSNIPVLTPKNIVVFFYIGRGKYFCSVWMVRYGTVNAKLYRIILKILGIETEFRFIPLYKYNQSIGFVWINVWKITMIISCNQRTVERSRWWLLWNSIQYINVFELKQTQSNGSIELFHRFRVHSCPSRRQFAKCGVEFVCMLCGWLLLMLSFVLLLYVPLHRNYHQLRISLRTIPDERKIISQKGNLRFSLLSTTDKGNTHLLKFARLKV